MVAGRVFALSTAGSLLGTFVPALLTIPLIGTQRTLLGAAAVVALAAALLLGRRWLLAALALAVLLAVPPGLVKAEPGVIYEGESRYQFIEVVQQGRGARRALPLPERGLRRALGVAPGHRAHRRRVGHVPHAAAAARPSGRGTSSCWATRPARPPAPSARSTRGVAYDGVEIDPQVTAVARRYFGLGQSRASRSTTADARPFLQATTKRYDLIMVDAYRQPYVPFYLATREFFALCRERLAPGGIVALNVSTVPGDPRLVDGIAGTLATEFPQVVVWPALRFNDLVIGLSQRRAAG